MGLLLGIQLYNVLIMIAGIVGFGLFIIVMLKLNKALDIWLEQNKRR